MSREDKPAQMTQTAKELFALLGLGIESTHVSDKRHESLLTLSIKQWKDVVALAEIQGVAAIAFDGVQRLYEGYGKEIKAAGEAPSEWLQWVFECTGIMTQYEQRCQKQRRAISELSDIWAEEGIRTMIFKGQANAALYPEPGHRATGDIDCFLFGQAERGDTVLRERNAGIDNRWYRHSKITYMGETIENHRVMSHTRGGKKRKEMEEELKGMIDPTELNTIEGCGKALMPTTMFNACFLTYHALHHFISEGLRMKQIVDWAVFLQKEQEQVDWPCLVDFCKRYKLDRFMEVMNYIAVQHLGVTPTVKDMPMNGYYAEKILQSTLYEDDYLFNSGKSDWAVRWQLVRNMLTNDRWKYRDIAQENVYKHLWQNIIGFLEKD